MGTAGTDLERALVSLEPKYFTKDGKVVDERVVVNETARAKARDQVFDLTDILRPRSDSTAGSRPVVVNIRMPEWAKTDAKVSDDGHTVDIAASPSH